MSRARPLLSSPWFRGTLLFAILFWTFDLAVLRAGVPHPLDDTWEDGMVARMLVEGRGFRTQMIYPPLWELRDRRDLSMPVVVHGPLLPLLLAPPLRLAGPEALDAIAWLAALWAVLAAVFLFRVARRLFGDAIAAGAAILCTLSPLLIEAVHHYASVVLGAWLVAWTLDLLLRERPRAFAAGLVTGVGSLTRPELTLAAPLFAALAALGLGEASARAVRPVRWGPALAYLAAFALAACAWWLERWRTVGSPFFNLTSYLLVSFSAAHPGDALVRDFAATPRAYPALLAESWRTLPAKWLHAFPRGIKRALVSPQASTGWLAPLGLVAWASRRDLARVALPLVGLALVPVVAVTTLAPVALYPVPFLALWALAAALGARWLVERLPPWAHRPRVWLALLAMAALPPAAIALREQEAEARRLERWLAADRAALAPLARVPGPRLLFSDTPDFAAWTTRRPTVWLTLEETHRLYDSPSPLPAGLPATIEPRDTWFHADDPRRSEGQRGTHVAAPIPHAGTARGSAERCGSRRGPHRAHGSRRSVDEVRPENVPPRGAPGCAAPAGAL